MNNKLREQIKELKKEKGITYTFIYKQLGWGKSTFHNWIYSQYDLSNEKIQQLVSFINEHK